MGNGFFVLGRKFTASHPQIPKPAGVLTVARFVPHGNWRTPLLANSPSRGCWVRRPLVGRAPGCDLSDPSHVMEPRGTASHTATAMDPVHGSQWSVSSTDTTLTAQQGAVLRSSYGSDSMGEEGVLGLGFNGLYGSTKPAQGHRSAAFLSE